MYVRCFFCVRYFTICIMGKICHLLFYFTTFTFYRVLNLISRLEVPDFSVRSGFLLNSIKRLTKISFQSSGSVLFLCFSNQWRMSLRRGEARVRLQLLLQERWRCEEVDLCFILSEVKLTCDEFWGTGLFKLWLLTLASNWQWAWNKNTNVTWTLRLVYK